MPPNTPMIEETSLTRIEEMMLEYRNKIKTSVTKVEKKEMLKKLKNLEKHWNNINDKHINGKKYPERIYHSDDKPMDKKTIFKLIDSVDSAYFNHDNSLDTNDFSREMRLYRPDVKFEG